ncbi:MAG: hypothetical protein IJR94_04800 [Synergistaceae bacterium]|nr:hypothetical protein [Synergistaceae bacterium]
MNATYTSEKETLDYEVSLMKESNLKKLVSYARFLNFVEVEDEDDSWADAPLTPEEEEEVRQGHEELQRGEYLTLEEFRELMACGE